MTLREVRDVQVLAPNQIFALEVLFHRQSSGTIKITGLAVGASVVYVEYHALTSEQNSHTEGTTKVVRI